MKTKLVIIILLGGFFSGCFDSNFRTFKNQNIEAVAWCENNKWQYYEVKIGNPANPFNNNLFFSIQTEEDAVIGSRDFNIKTIQKIAKLQKTTLKPLVTYKAGPYSFVFKDDKLVQLRIYSWLDSAGWHFPKIIMSDNKSFTLPLDEQELIELFDRPESVEDKFVW